jgi:hypothetical protein
MPALEGLDEITLVTATQGQGDIHHRHARVLQVAQGQFQAHLVQQFTEAGALRFQLALQLAFGDVEQGCRPCTIAGAISRTGSCWEPLWQVREPGSGYDPDRQAPFSVGLKVYPVKGA